MRNVRRKFLWRGRNCEKIAGEIKKTPSATCVDAPSRRALQVLLKAKALLTNCMQIKKLATKTIVASEKNYRCRQLPTAVEIFIQFWLFTSCYALSLAAKARTSFWVRSEYSMIFSMLSLFLSIFLTKDTLLQNKSQIKNFIKAQESTMLSKRTLGTAPPVIASRCQPPWR